MKTKVAIVDDHLLIAKAISGIIEKFDGFEVVFQAENGIEMQQKLKFMPSPDIILMDISMPIMDGFEATDWLFNHYPAIKVLALTMQNDDEALLKMVNNGAKGYLLKNIHPNDLLTALQQVVDHGVYYPNWVAAKLFSRKINTNQTENILKFTDRETEFLKYCVSEMTYKEIADLMNCSPRTAEGYRDALFLKLNIKTRVGLAIYALKMNLA